MDIWKWIYAFRNVARVILVIMILVSLVVFFVPQVYLTIDAKVTYLFNKNSGLYDLPSFRQINENNDKNNSINEISKFGIKFNTTWNNMKFEKEGSATAEISFDNNISLRLAYYEGGYKLVENIKEKDPDIYKAMLNADGQKNFESEFEFCKYYLGASPQKLSILSSKDKVNSQQALLSIKQKTIRNVGKGLYIYDSPKIKAIQYGSPDMNNKDVWIDLFDNKGNRYSLRIFGDIITQNDIDYVLSTIELTNE